MKLMNGQMYAGISETGRLQDRSVPFFAFYFSVKKREVWGVSAVL
ncbi:hypothetical protein [Paenibacillus amylolyticus]